MGHIFAVEKNVHGGLTIYGTTGVKQYYGYTKTEAKRLYNKEAEAKIFYNKKGI